jgi:Flp pilus assembly protein TadD
MNIEKIKLKIQRLVNHYNTGDYLYVIREAGILIKKFPTNSYLMNLIGSCFQKIGQFEKAKKIFEDNIAINPNNFDAMNNLGNTYKLLENYKDAELMYSKALKINPNFSESLQNLANLKFELHDYDQALILYNKAYNSNPNNFLALYNLGLVYQSLGKFEDAEKTLKKVLEINPNFTKAYKILSRFKKFQQNDELILEMEKKIKDPNLLDQLKPDILFALGKAYEDVKNFEKSFKYYDEANSTYSKVVNYKFDNDENLFISLKDFFQNIDFSEKNYKNENIKNFIFIVGLPRSGTSLTEQIIASHSNVFGGGELAHMGNIIRKKLFHNQKLNFNKFSEILENNTQRNFGNLYYKLSGIENYKEEYLTDKNPMNFLWIGFINLIFPKAKIINIRRNLKDNFLSLYKNMFDGNLNWSYNKMDLLKFCKYYDDLMKFWNKKIPNNILDIYYEDLINDNLNTTKKILNFCNLKWEDQCLKFYENKRAIRTVSSAQARSPIYKDSVKAYENYQIYLDKFYKELDSI